MSVGNYSAVVLTFRRPHALSSTLRTVASQDLKPQLIVVVDNDPAGSARSTFEAAATDSSVEWIYVAPRTNLGPAGGWSLGMRTALEHACRGEWVFIFDDDDPPSDSRITRKLMESAASLGERVGAIGMRGAILSRWRWRLVRVHLKHGSSAEVDYLASNGSVAYRWSALAEVGFFDDSLFFGFEDLDLGLRLSNAGYTVVALDLSHWHTVADTAPARVPWREYYKYRSLVVICQRYGGSLAMFVLCVRSFLLGSVRLLWEKNGPRLVLARLLAAKDGMTGSLGPRRYAPTENPPK